MTTANSAKRNPDDYITVTVLRTTHDEIKKYFEDEGNGFHMGKFYDKAAMERLIRVKKRNTPFDFLSTEILLKNGWVKSGSTYKKGESVIMYTGTYWFCNGEQLTPDNFREYIGNKMSLKK